MIYNSFEDAKSALHNLDMDYEEKWDCEKAGEYCLTIKVKDAEEFLRGVWDGCYEKKD